MKDEENSNEKGSGENGMKIKMCVCIGTSRQRKEDRVQNGCNARKGSENRARWK